ncbi:MAG: hypothetical protein RL199_978, partial [Pseudomonadota bacterium]
MSVWRTSVLAAAALVCGCSSLSLDSSDAGRGLLGLDAGLDGVVLVGTDVTLSAKVGTGVVGVRWSQVSGPSVQLSDSQSLTPTFRAPTYPTPMQRNIVLRLEGTDGDVVESDLVKLQLNQAPTLSVPSLGGLVARAGEPLVCRIEPPTDADGDAVTYAFAWTLNGANFPGAVSDGPSSTVPASAMVDGDVWRCTVSATDGMHSTERFTERPVGGLEVVPQVSFGAVLPGHRATREVALRNVAARPIVVREVVMSSPSQFEVTTNVPFEVPAGGEALLGIAYAPTALTSDTADVVVRTQDRSQPELRFAVDGRGGGPDIAVAPTELTFPLTAVSRASVAHVVVRNGGYDDLVIDALTSSSG